MNADVSRRERFRALFGAVALAVVVMLVGQPVVQAATQAVRVKGKVNVKVADTNGDAIESEAIGPMGILLAEGTDGAIAVRNFAGGGGFLGAADCTETEADGLKNFVEVSNVIVTGIIITGTDGTWTATSQSVAAGQLPLLQFRVNADNPNEFVGLGNGLTVTAPLKFSCAGTNSRMVVLGQ